MFRYEPMCEICGRKAATHFSLERPNTTDHHRIKEGGVWRFVCEDEENYNEMYYVPIGKMFESPSETVDWMAHLNEKGWMNWDNFMEMIYRFRREAFGFNK